eukprot:6491467-Amphidinium_carterae.1
MVFRHSWTYVLRQFLLFCQNVEEILSPLLTRTNLFQSQGTIGQYRVKSPSNVSTHYVITNLPKSHLSYTVSPTSDGVGQHLLVLNRLRECLKYSISPSLQQASSYYQELFIDSLFSDISGKESKEISMWIDGRQEEQAFAGSLRLNPMDQHVKHMMRSVDSLKGQTEYNMDTVTGNLFAKLKRALLYTRKKYIPRVSFQTCVVVRGTYGIKSPLLEMDDTGFVLWWFKNQRPYELDVASAADFREVMRRYPAHKLSLVSFWTGEDDERRDDENGAKSTGGFPPAWHQDQMIRVLQGNRVQHMMCQWGRQEMTMTFMQQGGQLLHQYANPKLPLGMFPQAIEPITQAQDFQQSLNPYQETLLWPGHSLSDPPQP